MEKVRLGYIGCGFMAQKVPHPEILQAFLTVNSSGLQKCDPNSVKKVQSRFGIPHLYRDHEQLAQNADIEAVAVSPRTSHYRVEIAKDLLLAGKHVFMEKPMAVSTEQAEAIVAASRKSGKKVDGRLYETLRCRKRDRQVKSLTVPRNR